MSKKESVDKKNNPTQSQKFIQTAKKAGADEGEPTFNAKLGRIAKAVPKATPKGKGSK